MHTAGAADQRSCIVGELAERRFESSLVLDQLLARCAAGDQSARTTLINRCSSRFLKLTRTIKADYPQLGRWEQTDDICQEATLKIWEDLHTRTFENGLHFYRTTARIIRHTLIDLMRHHFGPQGIGRQHHSVPMNPDESSQQQRSDPACNTFDPQLLAQWTELHDTINRLSPSSTEMFDLMYYHELSQHDAGLVLGISDRQVRRRWGQARDELAALLEGEGFAR